jgi:heat shock protein HslJ
MIAVETGWSVTEPDRPERRRMGMRMTLAVAGLVGALALGGCGRAEGGGGPGGPGEWPADRTFYSTAVTDGATPRALAPGTRIELRFFADGRLSAQAGCNHLGGDGRVEDGRLVLGDLSMTEMGCDPLRMAQDTWLSTFLGARPTWTLAGDELRLRGGEVEIVLADRRVADPDRPLLGTRWVVDTIINDDIASSVPAGTEAFLTFDQDGVLGHTGCRAIRGDVTVTETTLRFTSVGGLDGQCVGGAATTHDAMATILREEVTYRVEGPTLSLTTADHGVGLRLRAA